MSVRAMRLADFPARFASKVEVDASGCWLWQAGLNRNGYGRYMLSGSNRDVVAHRYAYEVATGNPIPDGLVMDHLCRVRHCVNPEHVEPVTQRENLLRGQTRTARQVAATECPAGHPYAGDNLYVNPSGDRLCRECHRRRVAAARLVDPEKTRAEARERDARYRARKRAQRADHPDYRAEWRP